jgi:serine/threonine protein phosphatase 1
MTSTGAPTSGQRPAEGQLLATLRPGSRIWAVGSVHGDVDRLAALHRELWRRLGPGDQIVYLGGYLGYGPSVIDTVNELLLFRRAVIATPGADMDDVIYLRGAQEEVWQKLLQLQFAQGPGAVLDWMIEHGADATISAYGGRVAEGKEASGQGVLALTRWTNTLRQAVREWDGHSTLMSTLRHAAQTADGKLLFVHAGLDPARPVESQVDRFWWGANAFETLDQPYGDYALVVRGFAPPGPMIRTDGPIVTIDGGSGRGGTLVAVCLDGQGAITDSIQV